MCLLVPVTLHSIRNAIGFNNISGLLRQEVTKTMHASKDNSCSSLNVQVTVRIHLTIQ